MQDSEQPVPQPERRVRSKFTPHEDETIIRIVNEFGPRAWRLIASNLPGRSARQIRERYVNYLSPKVCNDPWTFEEDQRLREKVAQHGRKWSKIAKFFKNRTDVIIKNRWSKLQRCDRRKTETENANRGVRARVVMMPQMYIIPPQPVAPPVKVTMEEEVADPMLFESGPSDLFLDVFDRCLEAPDFGFNAPIEWDAHF